MLPLFKFALFFQKKEFGPPPKEVLENNVRISLDRWVDTRAGEEFELNDFVGDSVWQAWTATVPVLNPLWLISQNILRCDSGSVHSCIREENPSIGRQ